MGRVVLIHGMGQQASNSGKQLKEWLPSLVKGVLRSNDPAAGRVAAALAASASGDPKAAVVQMAFYGDLFRSEGLQGDVGGLDPDTEALVDALAVAMLRSSMGRGEARLTAEAGAALAELDPDREGVQGVGSIVRGAVSHLDRNPWLSARIFGLAQRARTDLVQVARYLTDEAVRVAVQGRLTARLSDDTSLLIAHSLGTVVAWETCVRWAGTVPMLVTIGSPLGLETVIYRRLRPPPPAFPAAVGRWVNVAHPDDIVAAQPRLAGLFPSDDGRRVEDRAPASRSEHHAAATYLEQSDVGMAAVDALAQ